MADEPDAKRQKLDDIPKHLHGIAAGVKRTIVQMDGVQTQIDVMNEKASEEILKIEQKYNALRAPLFERRAGLIKDVPNFWSTAFLNHPQLGCYVVDSELNLVKAITEIEVEEYDPSKYKIKFSFSDNEFFDAQSVTKVVSLGDNASTTTTEVQWKQGKRPQLKPHADTITFAEWLYDDVDPTVDDVCELIKDDLWANPMQYFLSPNVEEEDDGDDLLDLADEDSEDDEEAHEATEEQENGAE